MFSFKPLLLPFPKGTFHSNSSRGWPARLCRQQLGHDFKHAIDVEDDHELTLKAMHAAGELGQAGIEIDRIVFSAITGKPQHLTDLINQESVGFAAQVDAYGHRRLALLVLWQAE